VKSIECGDWVRERATSMSGRGRRIRRVVDWSSSDRAGPGRTVRSRAGRQDDEAGAHDGSRVIAGEADP